jgi:hypothetical protein
MTFDTERTKQILTEISEQAYIVRKLYGVKSRNKQIATAEVSSHDKERCRFSVDHLPMKVLSNHAKLIDEGARARVESLLDELLDMIAAAAPILRTNDLHCYLNIGLKKYGRAHMTLSLNDITLGLRGHAQEVSEVAGRLTRAISRIAQVEPGPREFEFDGWHKFRAATPEGAYRIYAALAKPGMFDAEISEGGSPITMTEVMCTKSSQAALLASG